jgi:hypothetical protein
MSTKTPATDALTDLDMLAEPQDRGPFHEARRVFSSASAGIEQACAQRVPASPLQVRRMEFAAVEGILAAFGLVVDPATGEARQAE